VLDNEPDATQTTSAAAAAPSTPPARRRRAASRPAGPPAAPPPVVETPPAAAPVVEEPAVGAPAVEAPVDAPVAEAPDAETPDAETPAEETPDEDTPPPGGLESAASTNPDPVGNRVGERLDALVAESATTEPEARPARRTRKTAARKSAAAAELAPADPTDEPPAERPARRRARKTVAAAPETETPVVELDVLSVEDQVEAAPGEAEVPQVVTPDVAVPEVEAPPAAPLSLFSADDVHEPAADRAADDGVSDDAGASGGEVVAPVDQAPEQDDAVEDEETEDDEDEDDSSADASADTGDGRRRRRRRGGRRRRRTGDGESDDAADDADATGPAEGDQTADAAVDAPADEAAAADADADEQNEEGDGTRRRRRRRRRRGEEAEPAPDDPTEVVVRVREPRKAKAAKPTTDDQVTGITGSTRMEAKRQRRRDGRDAGRRRAPILSEAEFLARREAVTRRMIIRQREDLTQIAVLEDDILVEHYVDRESATSLIGNVYLARVQNVLPSMEAAFVDIGRGRNAVIYAGEVDWDSFGAQGQNRKVEKVLKSGQTILVQVTKDPFGAKGARLTNHVSIPGRYIVYAPSGHLSGISRKLPENERKRLKDILSGLVGEASVIVRTAAEGASEEELVRDVNRLKAQWSDIEAKVAGGHAPQLLYGEPDLTVRIVRDLFTEDFAELIVSGNGGPDDAYDAIDGYVAHVAPHLADRLKRYVPEDGDEGDVFGRFRIDEQIAKALERKVFLPSGGSLVIDRTEAMTVIDVNTGKFTGSGGNLEATVTSNNLEAAEEIVRQLRLRDVGGIIVIDFIDMVLPANRELLLRRLVECLGRDRTRHQVAEVTSLGLVQMTRKKIGTGLIDAFSSECAVCHGRGYEIHEEPVDSQRQADGGAREQRGGGGRGGSSGNGASGRSNGGSHGGGSNGGSSNGGGANGGTGNGHGGGNDSGHGSDGDSGRSGGRGRGRGRGRADDAPEPSAGSDEPESATDPAIKAAVQHAIAEVAASSRSTSDEVDS